MSLLNDVLADISNESGINYELEPVDTTADEIIIEHKEEGTAVDMLQHASDARDIAEDLENIAERADKLAEEDATYAEASVESAGREFDTIMKANKLNYSATSFESQITTSNRAVGLAEDARRAAHDLRVKADLLSDLSTEGWLADLFKSKDEKMSDALKIIKNESIAIKGKQTELKEKGVLINNKGLASFLTKDGELIKDFKKAYSDDVKFLISWMDAIKKDINFALTSKSLKTTDYYKNLSSILPYSILGGYNIHLLVIDKGVYALPSITRTPYGDKMARLAVTGRLIAVGLTVGTLVLAPAAVPAAAAGNIVAAVGSIVADSKINNQNANSILSASDYQSIVSESEKLLNLGVDKSWESDLSKLEMIIKDATDNKEILVNMFRYYKSTLGLFKDIALEYLSNTAKLLEQTNKSLKVS